MDSTGRYGPPDHATKSRLRSDGTAQGKPPSYSLFHASSSALTPTPLNPDSGAGATPTIALMQMQLGQKEHRRRAQATRARQPQALTSGVAGGLGVARGPRPPCDAQTPQAVCGAGPVPAARVVPVHTSCQVPSRERVVERSAEATVACNRRHAGKTDRGINARQAEPQSHKAHQPQTWLRERVCVPSFPAPLCTPS